MPLKGFRDIHGEKVNLEDIRYVEDAARFNCSPATLKSLLDNVRARDGVDFSASQLSTTTRQHLLRSRDYYPPTAQAMSAYLGTIKHQQINVAGDRLIVEQRFVSKRDPRISGQIDHAAIIELTDDGTLVVDLYDLKTTKWYPTTLIAKDVWRNHPEYAWQLNLCAALIEESHPADFASRSFGNYHFGDTANSNVNPFGVFHNIRVRNLYLECIPADGSYKHQDEAVKLGLPEYQKVLIPVDRKSADETYAVYFDAMKLRDDAIAAGYAPLCKDRWSNRNISDLRCLHYCDVRDECIQFQHDRGEAHPIAPLDVALAESIKQAEAANA